MKRPEREWYFWLRWCGLPLTIYLNALDWRLGIAIRKMVDGSGQHRNCWEVIAMIPFIKFETVLKWGPAPFHKMSFESQGFGNIGGLSLSQRQRAMEIGSEQLIDDDEE